MIAKSSAQFMLDMGVPGEKCVEIVENMDRQPESPEELYDIQEYLRPFIEAVNGPGRPNNKLASQDANLGRTDEVLGALTGESAATVRRRKVIFKAYEADPETYGDIYEELMIKGDVHPCYHKVMKRRKQKARQEQAARQATEREARGESLPSGIEIVNQDFRMFMESMPSNSVDLIFTDPPYDKLSIPLYGDLAQMAKRVLKPGASLICYAGQHAMQNILNVMSPHLRYWWMLAVKHAGGSTSLTGVKVYVSWKPMLWFVKGTNGRDEFVFDLVDSTTPDKTHHEWGQSVTEAAYYIDQLTDVDALVLDPMCGSGTTLIAAHSVGRRCLGIEKDSEKAQAAKERMHGYLA